MKYDAPISGGPLRTCQMWAHDPDTNKFEIMQFNEDFYQEKVIWNKHLAEMFFLRLKW